MAIINIPSDFTATISNCVFNSNTTSVWTNTASTTTAISSDNYFWYNNLPKDKKLEPGTIHKLPDGSKVVIDFNGNYEIIDKNAIVTYQANNIREFNKYVNASDLLESFIRDVGKLGVKQKDIFSLPIDLFINWLIVKAAEKDGDKINIDFDKKVTQYLLPA